MLRAKHEILEIQSIITITSSKKNGLQFPNNIGKHLCKFNIEPGNPICLEYSRTTFSAKTCHVYPCLTWQFFILCFGCFPMCFYYQTILSEPSRISPQKHHFLETLRGSLIGNFPTKSMLIHFRHLLILPAIFHSFHSQLYPGMVEFSP